MYFQNDEDVSLPLPLDVQLSQDMELWEHSYPTVQEFPGATDYPWMEQRHYGDGTMFYPPLGMGAEHSGTHLPQFPLYPFEPSQSSRVPQVPRDQSADFILPYDTENVGRATNEDVGVDPGAVEENRAPVEASNPTKKRSNRARLQLDKIQRIDEIRTIVGLGLGTSELQVLHAAINRLECDVPQAASDDEWKKLAYRTLHQRTGSQGSLQHARCLDLVIEALRGRPTLNPIFFRR